MDKEEIVLLSQKLTTPLMGKRVSSQVLTAKATELESTTSPSNHMGISPSIFEPGNELPFSFVDAGTAHKDGVARSSRHHPS